MIYHHQFETNLLQLSVMESRVSVSKVSGLVSVSKVSGLVSVSKVSGLETLNIAKKWFIKFSIIQRFFVCCICR